MRVSFKLNDLKIAQQCHRFRMNQQCEIITMFVVGVAGTSCQLPLLLKGNRCQPSVCNLVSCSSVYTKSIQKLANVDRQCERGFMLYFPHKGHKTNPNHR